MKTPVLTARTVLLVILFTVPLGSVPPVRGDDTVPPHLRPGGGTGPLEFEEVAVPDRSDTSLTVTWRTNRPARARVQFGRSGPSEQFLRSATREEHVLTVDKLTPGTTYRFRIFARNDAGNRIKSQVVKTRTSGVPPPRIRDLKVTDRTMNGGTLRWGTNVPTRIRVEAGHDTPFKHRTVQDSPSRHHRVNLTHFYPDRDLYYRIVATDTRGESTATKLRSFATREANVAQEKPVRGTFDRPIYGVDTGSTGTTPWIERINDGNYSYQRGTANSGDPADTGQYFVVDLEEFVTPGRAVFYWRDIAFPREYEILGSRNGHDWIRLAGDLNAENGTHTLSPIENMKVFEQTVNLPDTVPSVQFIKIQIPKGASYYGKYDSYDFVQLLEFKLFPAQVPTPDNGEEGTLEPTRRINEPAGGSTHVERREVIVPRGEHDRS